MTSARPPLGRAEQSRRPRPAREQTGHDVSAASPGSRRSPPETLPHTGVRAQGVRVVAAALGSRVTPITAMVTPWVLHGASSLSLDCRVGGYDLPHQSVLRLTRRPVHGVPTWPPARGRRPRSRGDGGPHQPRSSREDRGCFLWKREVERDHPPPVGRGLGALGSGPLTARGLSPSTLPLCPEPRESRVPQPGHRGKEVPCVPLVSRLMLKLSRARPRGPTLPAPLISSPGGAGCWREVTGLGGPLVVQLQRTPAPSPEGNGLNSGGRGTDEGAGLPCRGSGARRPTGALRLLWAALQ